METRPGKEKDARVRQAEALERIADAAEKILEIMQESGKAPKRSKR